MVEDSQSTEQPLMPFLRSLCNHWLALMSCAAFTFLGLWVTFAEKDRLWILWASAILAIGCFVFAAYKAWADQYRAWANERRTVQSLMQKPSITIAVHGIFAHIAEGDEILVILPDVSVANQSHGLRVALTADLWMLRDGGMEGWCSPSAVPVAAWENSQHSYRNKAITLPLNLEPRCAEQGYLAFSHRVLRGVGNRPIVDQYGHWRYRIEFKDIHAEGIIHQQEITVAPFRDIM